jgi:hypothetical protein
MRPHITDAHSDARCAEADRLAQEFLDTRQILRVSHIENVPIPRIAQSNIGGTERILCAASDIVPMRAGTMWSR